MKKRALLSVFDKTGIIPLAEQLTALGYDIISTGGTSKILEDAMIPVIRIEDLTGFEAILGGRVKTLHPKVFGGILARRDDSIDMKTLEDDQIMPIDLVVVNLYPFLQALELGKDEKELIEMMDIGGVSLVRAAAKNYPFVTVITDPQDYQLIMNEVEIDTETAGEPCNRGSRVRAVGRELAGTYGRAGAVRHHGGRRGAEEPRRRGRAARYRFRRAHGQPGAGHRRQVPGPDSPAPEIGRASCRERV